MEKRLQLHELLCEILGSRNVYFQPPETVMMNYPAIVYALDNIDNKHANGGVYLSNRRYTIIVIDDDPDSAMVDRMSTIPLCRFVRSYTADNLYHYIFELYY